MKEPPGLLSTSLVCFFCIRFPSLTQKVRSEGVHGLCGNCGETREVAVVSELIDHRPEFPVCYACIDDKVVSDDVKAAGYASTCRYCGETRESITWNTLIERPMVCHACIGDRVLTEEVKSAGILRLCSYCGETRAVIALSTLANRIHETLQDLFRITTEDQEEPHDFFHSGQVVWLPPGEPVREVISDIAGLSEDVAADIDELLEDSFYTYVTVKEGGPYPYGSEAFYEERDPADEEWRFRDTWEAFRAEVGSHARFFSPYALEMLTSILGDLSDLRSDDGRPVIRIIDPEDDDRFIWRARKALSSDELVTILRSPAQELGPPPSAMAESGRMNAKGISVFYGAMEMSTCIAEIRPPVGGSVVMGTFEIIRRVRLLDLDALANSNVPESHFSPEYKWQRGRISFLRRLASEISRPVMPQDEEREYLPTQIVAEYLATSSGPDLDGIIFRSSQTAGEGSNLVLFNRACSVAPYHLPTGANVTVSLPRPVDDEDIYRSQSVSVFEEVPPGGESPSETKESASAHASNPPDEEPNEDPSSAGEPVMRLDVNSIVVLEIEGTKYSYNERHVSRHRIPKREGQFPWESEAF